MWPFSRHHLLECDKDAIISSFSCNHFDYYFVCSSFVSFHVIIFCFLICSNCGEVVRKWWPLWKKVNSWLLFEFFNFRISRGDSKLFIWIWLCEIFQFGMARAHQRALKIKSFHNSAVTGSIPCFNSFITLITHYIQIYTYIYNHHKVLKYWSSYITSWYTKVYINDRSLVISLGLGSLAVFCQNFIKNKWKISKNFPSKLISRICVQRIWV